MFVRRPDARLFTLGFGHGAQTLLALGGWVGSGEVWHDVFGQLPHWRCISYDHRGSGASTHSGGPITVRAMVDDLFAIADALQVDRCVLAAESSGAGIALEAALRDPRRFAGLALVGAAWQRPQPGASEALIEALRRDYAATLRRFVEQCLPEPDSEDLRRWGLQIASRAPLAHAIELLQCRTELGVQEHLAKIALPVLVMHGELDRIVPPQASRELAAALPEAELHILPGLGHVPILSAPATIARLIDDAFGTAAVRCAA